MIALFSCKDLEHIAGLNGLEAKQGLETLQTTGIIRQRIGKGNGMMAFRHAMMRDAAYLSMLRRNRLRYHRQVAELLISKSPDIVREQPELLAYHYSRTEHLEIAVGLWIRASDLAIRHSSISEAQSHAEYGLELCSNMDDSKMVRSYRLQLLLSRAACLTLRSGYYGHEIIDNYKECIVLASKVGTREQRYDALFGYWRCLCVRLLLAAR